MNQLTQVELTPEQNRMWEDTASLMVWTCPGFRHLWYKLMVNHNGKQAAFFTEDTDIPIAATDGKNIIIKPSTFFTLPLRQRAFVCAHEVMHNVYDDCNIAHRLGVNQEVPMSDGTKLPYSHELMNAAADYRINALLVDSKIGQMPDGEWKGLHDPAIGTAHDSVFDIYKKLYDDHKKNGGGNGPGGFDTLLSPGASTGQTPHQATQDRNAAQWAGELQVAQKLEEMKAQGKMAGSLKRMFDEALEPKVNWVDYVRGFLARRVGSGSYDWRKPDRRLIIRDCYAPGRSGHGAGWVVVLGDVSGSIGNAEMSQYMAEVGGLIEDVRPKRLTLMWVDDGIRRIDDEVDAGELAHIRCNSVPGGGGTDFKEAFAWVETHLEGPDCFICLTDGYVQFPKDPKVPVVWAMTTDVVGPFGETVRIK